MLIGIGIELLIGHAYGINWQQAEPGDFLPGILSYATGNMAFYAFVLLSMVVSLVLIIVPYMKSKYPNSKLIPKINESGMVIPLIRGATFGFGIMIFYYAFTKGIQPLFG